MPASAAITGTESRRCWTPLPGACGDTPGGQVQDDLVSYGADEARVELDFLARDGRFRVIRSRRRGGGRRRQGASDMQLVSVTEDGDAAQIVSGNSIRETQGRVEQLVGMDYETFINSAFLMQGRADEFTNKSPAERKAVLSSDPGAGSLRPVPGQGAGQGVRKSEVNRTA